MITKWDKRFLDLAQHIAQWSKDPSTKCGAVIVGANRNVISMGYNGFASGVHDTEERLNNREIKYKMVVHCERNAIIYARQDLRCCTLYTWPFMTCAPCAAMVIQAGINRVVAPFSANERWAEDFQIANTMYTEAGVTLHLDHEVLHCHI